jgi:ribosomal protein L30E
MNLFDSEHTIHAIIQHNAKVYVVAREPRVSLKETIDHLKSQALK